MSAPWMKFYPRDWRGDQALRAVSIGARGLWIECLCIMHEARPYGHLLLNGGPVEGDALARMTGATVDEVSAYMSELRKAGVFSVTREGVIFSRRMTMDHARAGKGRKAAQKRWSQVHVNTSVTDAPNGSANGIPITQKPEARDIYKDANASLSEPAVPTPVEGEKKKRKRVAYPSAFEYFWSAYPTDSLMSKKSAADVWARMSDEDRQQATSAVPAFVAYCSSHPDYRPVHANRFLSQRRYDGFVEMDKKGRSRKFITVGTAEWAEAARKYEEENGRRPPTTADKKSGEPGWFFPVEWFSGRSLERTAS